MKGVACAERVSAMNGIANETNIGRFSYTGQITIPGLGLYQYKARIYSPTLGRFLQTDPIDYGDGVNIYAYVQGDPINYIDPYGLNAEGVDDCPPKECIEVNGEPEPKVTINIGPLLGIGGGLRATISKPLWWRGRW